MSVTLATYTLSEYEALYDGAVAATVLAQDTIEEGVSLAQGNTPVFPVVSQAVVRRMLPSSSSGANVDLAGARAILRSVAAYVEKNRPTAGQVTTVSGAHATLTDELEAARDLPTSYLVELDASDFDHATTVYALIRSGVVGALFEL